jgi:predicted Rossmann fold flavoprotein
MSATRWDVIIIGAGAAGLLAATRAAERGRRALLLEKNPRPGAKLLMAGGGRCNVTHDADARGIAEAFGPPGRFLHPALAAFGPHDLVALLEAEGVAVMTEADGRVFPASGKAADVLAALLARLRRSGCETAFGEPVREMDRAGGGFRLVTDRRTLFVPAVLLAPGGRSYPACGTTGDGYRWAERLGHAIVPTRPALVPVTTDAAWVRALRGVAIADAAVRVVSPAGGNGTAALSPPAARRGAVLFTHTGLSGPAVLDVSRAVGERPGPRAAALAIDLAPDVPAEALDAQLRRAGTAAGRRRAAALLPEALPKRLRDALAAQAGIPPHRTASGLTRAERARLVETLKALRVPLTGTLGYARAEVTAGGVALDEVDPRTMSSRKVPGLAIAGELLDLDGPIGGYNLQAAFSTGWAAGGQVK